MPPTTTRGDRARGVLLATAAGDALGAGYEFGPPLPADAPVTMSGGGFGWEPGEWTDDTAMAIAIAETAATGADLRDPGAQDTIVARWATWARTARDVGTQTRRVLAAVTDSGGAAAANAKAAAAALHDRTGRTAGNGALMRTAPVALAYLDDPDGLTEAATALSALTHHDPACGQAATLWCHAIRHAVLTGSLDAHVGVPRLAPHCREAWERRLEIAERSRPSDFVNNGWVVEALQAAWCAITTTPVPADDPRAGTTAADHLRLALANAVRGGRDTDTVAAIAGGLLGATWGATAVPSHWRALLHGWPGTDATGLDKLTTAILDATPPTR